RPLPPRAGEEAEGRRGGRSERRNGRRLSQPPSGSWPTLLPRQGGGAEPAPFLPRAAPPPRAGEEAEGRRGGRSERRNGRRLSQPPLRVVADPPPPRGGRG